MVDFNTLRFLDILKDVKFNDYSFIVNKEGENYYMQALFPAQCNKTGNWETQSTRKWRLSVHMTKSEVVQTALKLVLTSIEHEAREQFKYRDQPIFGPHYDVDQLVDIVAAGKSMDVRHDG